MKFSSIIQNPINSSSCTTTCSSKAVLNQMPNWDQICLGSDQFIFLQNARIYFDVYDYHGKGDRQKLFIAGSSINIEELLQRRLNNRDIYFQFINNQRLYVRITFSVKVTKSVNKISSVFMISTDADHEDAYVPTYEFIE